MPAGGELAALFARRKVADEDSEPFGGTDAKEDVATVVTRASNDPNNFAPSPSAPRPSWPTPRSMPQATSLRLPPSMASTPQPARSPPSMATPASLPAAEPVKVATPAENDELKARFENRNLEAGIPTPSFLLNARANLKRSASEKGDAAPSGGVGAVKAAAAALSVASSSSGGTDAKRSNSVTSAAAKLADKINNGGANLSGGNFGAEQSSDGSKKSEQTTPSAGGYAKKNSFRKTTVIGNGSNGNHGSENISDASKTFERTASSSSASGRGNSFSSARGGGAKTSHGSSNISDDAANKKHEKGAQPALPTFGYSKSTSFSSAGAGSKVINNSDSNISRKSDCAKSNSFSSAGGVPSTINNSDSNVSGMSDYAKSNSFSSAGGGGKVIYKSGSNISGITDASLDANKKYERAASLSSNRAAINTKGSSNSSKKSTLDSSRITETLASSGSIPSAEASKSGNAKNGSSMSLNCSSSDANNVKSSSFSSTVKVGGNGKTNISTNILGSDSTCSSDKGMDKTSNSFRSSKSDHDVPVDETAASLAGAILATAENDQGRGGSDSGGGSNPAAAASTSTSKNMLTARRHRMVTSKRGTSASALLSARVKKASPASARREKMLARARASKTTNNEAITGCGTGSIGIVTNFEEGEPSVPCGTPKTSIVSPKRDEFEVLFGDDNDLSPFALNTNYSSNNQSGVFVNALKNAGSNAGSIDSISSEMLYPLNISTDTSAATLPTNNIKPKGKVSIKDACHQDDKNRTPTKPKSDMDSQQSRLHNASTPKIRGNSAHRREFVGGSNASIGSDGARQSRQPPQMQGGTGDMQSFQQQRIDEQCEDCPQEPHSEDHLHELQQATPRRYAQPQHEIPQPYPMGHSPSQLSHISAITTPSCFPQEFNSTPLRMQSNTMGHLQEPMLVGGPIHENAMGHLREPMLVGGPIHEKYETASPASSPHPGAGFGTGLGGGNGQRMNSGKMGGGGGGQLVGSSSAFSSGRDSENRRLREELESMKKKLEQKDAIISQLMKRIGDLESSNSNATNQTQHHQHQHHVSIPLFATNPDSDPLLATSPSASTSLHSNVGGGNGGGGASRSTPLRNGTPDSYAMTTLWDHSQPAFRSATTSSSAFQQIPSNSHDPETLSVPSSAPVVSGILSSSPGNGGRASTSSQQNQTRQQKLRGSSRGRRSGPNPKMSPTTVATTSTSSVTTANSSKSNTGSKLNSSSRRRRRAPRSTSLSGDTMSQKCPNRHSAGGSQKSNDDRKFAC